MSPTLLKGMRVEGLVTLESLIFWCTGKTNTPVSIESEKPHPVHQMRDYPSYAVGTVEKGELMLSDAQKKVLNAYLKKNEGNRVRITFSKQEKGRSNNQNAYMWGVVLTMIAAETGHTTEEIHEYMKATFLPRHFIRLGNSNKEQQLTKSTTTLSTTDMEEYLEHIRAFAASELNMIIPLPHEILLPDLISSPQ